jgi:hypothetical protein
MLTGQCPICSGALFLQAEDVEGELEAAYSELSAASKVPSRRVRRWAVARRLRREAKSGPDAPRRPLQVSCASCGLVADYYPTKIEGWRPPR